MGDRSPITSFPELTPPAALRLVVGCRELVAKFQLLACHRVEFIQLSFMDNWWD